MTSPIDIFRVEHGGVMWLQSAATLESAKTRVEELAAHFAGDYLLLDQVTGDKIIFRSAGTGRLPEGDPRSPAAVSAI